MAGGTFPTSVPSYPTISASETLGTMGAGVGHKQTHANEETDIAALAAKLGTGASVAAANQVLRGTGAGVTAYGSIQTADIASGAVTGSNYAQAGSIVNITTTSYADVMTLSYTSAGGDLLVWATSSVSISSGTPGNHWLSIRLDSGTDVDLAQTDGTGTKMLPASRRFTTVSSGAHTIALRGINAAAGTYQSFYRTILVLEIKR